MNLFENVFLQQQFWHRAHLMGNLVWNEECGIAALDINGNVFFIKLKGLVEMKRAKEHA